MRFAKTDSGLTVHAPAKLNLFLEVLGKRTDGFHELETLMVSINLYDTLTFTEESSGSVELHVSNVNAADKGSPVPTGMDNIVIKAATLLRDCAHIKRGVRIHLRKRIPVEAGLAGGSTDAAATLVALNQFWDAGLSTAELMELAAELGSDVSFFIPSTKAAICRGRGEVVQPVSVGCPLHFVVARPLTGLSTAAVFSKLDLSGPKKSISTIKNAIEQGNINQLARQMHNRLQPVAEQLNKDVLELQQEFSKQTIAGHLMSGSGSSCFAVCHSRRQAERLAAGLQSRLPISVFATQCRS